MAATNSVGSYEAKTHLPQLLDRVEHGESIVITRHGKPVARLVPYRAARAPRQLGRLRGRIWLADDFDAPLPPDLLAAFNGEDE